MIAIPAVAWGTKTCSSPSPPADAGLPAQPTQGVPTGPAEIPPVQSPPVQSPPVQSPPVQSPPAQEPPAQTQPGGTLTDTASLRTLRVGTDIQPGTYRTSGPAAGFTMCYWARLRDESGDVIAAGMPSGAAVVTIQPTDKAFQTGGCAGWTKA